MKKIISNKKIQKLMFLKQQDYINLKAKLDTIRKRSIDSDSLNELFFLSQHKDPSVRQTVIEIVKDKIKEGKRMKEQLYILLLIGVGDKDCRYKALEGLTYYPSKSSVFLLGSILLQDRDPLIRVEASNLLASLNQSLAIPFLERSLADEDPLVLVYSAYGLALLDSKESIPKLIQLQKLTRKMTVKVACWGGLLLLMKERMWIEKLLNVLNHSDYHVPMQVINYLNNAIEEGIILPEDVIPHIKISLRNEKRRAVSTRMKNFLDRYWKK